MNFVVICPSVLLLQPALGQIGMACIETLPSEDASSKGCQRLPQSTHMPMMIINVTMSQNESTRFRVVAAAWFDNEKNATLDVKGTQLFFIAFPSVISLVC